MRISKKRKAAKSCLIFWTIGFGRFGSMGAMFGSANWYLGSDALVRWVRVWVRELVFGFDGMFRYVWDRTVRFDMDFKFREDFPIFELLKRVLARTMTGAIAESN